MISGFKVLALVPARGGSKGLPGKNVRPFCGKALIGWSIDAAKACAGVDAIVVSTDDPAIAAAAAQFGAEVPFMRPTELGSDSASSIDVVIHALDALSAAGRTFDIVVLLEPTSPLRLPSDIDRGVEKMLVAGASAIVSVCRAESAHPAFMYRQTADSRLIPFLDRQPTGLRRQEIEALFFLEGTLYASRVDALRQWRSFYHDDTVAYEVPKWQSVEIDDVDDFVMAEALAKNKGLG